MSALRPLRRLPAWSLWLLLAFTGLLALLEALGPRGFSGRDEILALEGLARQALGGPAAPAWGNGFLLKHAQGWLLRLSGDWRNAHLPVLAALVLEGFALFYAGRRLGGTLVGQGALLGALISASALLQARSLLPYALLPALIACSLALLLRGGRAAFVGGLLLAGSFMEYEAALFAVPGFIALSFLEPRLRGAAKQKTFALGFALGLLGVLLYCHQDLSDWLTYRLTYNDPRRLMADGQLWVQLRSWFWGGRPEAYLGVTGHSVSALWSLPFIAIGLALQWKRRPWLPLWILAGLVTLLPSSGAFEPNRTVAAWPALALAGGFGWRWAWQRARALPALAWLLVLLPWAGLVIEQRAFDRSMQQGQERYSRSQGWMAAAKDPRFPGHTDAMLLPSGLAIETLMRTLQGAPAWVWLPGDLGEDAPAWPGVALYDRVGKLTGDTLAQVPSVTAKAVPLVQDLQALRPFWIALPRQRAAIAAACRQALDRPLVHSKLARAALWLELLKAAIPSNSLTPDDLDRLDAEDIHSFRFYRAANAIAVGKDSHISVWLLVLMRKHCGAERLTPEETASLQVPWEAWPVIPGSPAWRKPA